MSLLASSPTKAVRGALRSDGGGLATGPGGANRLLSLDPAEPLSACSVLERLGEAIGRAGMLCLGQVQGAEWLGELVRRRLLSFSFSAALDAVRLPFAAEPDIPGHVIGTRRERERETQN